jgi:hypothetical protein
MNDKKVLKSRKIGILDRARIIEFDSKGREAGLQYLVVNNWRGKLSTTCQNVESD